MALYAKVDCMLDSNPKIRKAGRCGREVFLFLLRRNRMLDARGFLSAGNIDPDYLADQLMMSREEAVTGVTACCNALLITVTHENIAIIGWSDEWAREPKSNAERQADHRRKAKETKLLDLSNHEPVTKSNGSNVTRNANNVRKEKKREEQKREEQKREEEYAAEAAPRASREAATSGFDPSSPHEPPSSRTGANSPPQPPFVASAASGQPRPKKRHTAQSSAVSTSLCQEGLDLWAEQERLRADAIPGSRRLKLTDTAAELISKILTVYSPEDCRHVLAVYHGNSKYNPETAKWFNGETNWRKENFARALGSPIPKPRVMRRADGTAPPMGPTALALMELERIEREAALGIAQKGLFDD